MPYFPIQRGFAAGEISPRMYGRVDAPQYKEGVEFSENFLHLPQGPARFRTGTTFVTEAYLNASAVRLIPFHRQQQLDYCLELTPGFLRVLSETGPVSQSGPELLFNNTFTFGTLGWVLDDLTHNVYVPNGTTSAMGMVTLVGGGANVARMYQHVFIPAGTYGFSASCSGPGVNRALLIQIGTSPYASDIYSGVCDIGGSVNISFVLGAPTNVWVSFSQNGVVAALASTDVILPSLRKLNSGSPVLIAGPWTETMLPAIQYVQDIVEGLFLVHPLMEPQRLKLDEGTGLFTLTAFSAIVGVQQPIVWGVGNYPSTVETFQSRLWFANTPQQSTTIWASETFNFYNFITVHVPLVQSDPFTLSLSTKGAIQWLKAKQTMLLGTEEHEDAIVSATQVISAVDAQLLRQSAYGSNYIQAENIGDQVLYVSRDGTKVRALNFNFDTQAWIAHDITFWSEHITNSGIRAITYARDPDNTIYLVMNDGTMRMCTYDRLMQTDAWTRWRTGGVVGSAAVTVDPTGGTTWLAVMREGVSQIEIIPPFSESASQWLDCWEMIPNPPIITITGGTFIRITGLVHEALRYVTVLIDGAYLGVTQVDSGGILVIPFVGATATVAVIGLPYTGTMRTLPQEGGVMYGTSQGLVKQRSRIFVRLMPGSALPLVNGTRPVPERDPQTLMNTSAPYGALDAFIINLGWDRYARVTIVQDLPFKTDLCAIFGHSEATQL